MFPPAPSQVGGSPTDIDAFPIDGGAFVWRLDLDNPVDTSSLSPDERARAARFHRDLDRARYTAGRASLRSILAGYLGRAPSALVFAYGLHGKPSLIGSELQFNVSHAGGTAMIAVARHPLGIDVERVDGRHATLAMAGTIFADDEIAAWCALPPALRTDGFFKTWTSREALAKALGQGLSVPRQSFAVCVDPTVPPRVLRGADGWRLQRLPAPDGHVATLAVVATAAPATMATADKRVTQIAP